MRPPAGRCKAHFDLLSNKRLNYSNHAGQVLQEMMDKLSSCQAKTSEAIEALVKQSEETERLSQAVGTQKALFPSAPRGRLFSGDAPRLEHVLSSQHTHTHVHVRLENRYMYSFGFCAAGFLFRSRRKFMQTRMRAMKTRWMRGCRIWRRA